MTGLRRKRRSSKQILLRRAVKRRTSDVAVLDLPRVRTSPQAKAITVVSAINRDAQLRYIMEHCLSNNSASSWEPRLQQRERPTAKRSIANESDFDRDHSRSSKRSRHSSSGYPSSWNLEVPRCDNDDRLNDDVFSFDKMLNHKPQTPQGPTGRKKKCNTAVQCKMPHRSKQPRPKPRSQTSATSMNIIEQITDESTAIDARQAEQRAHSGDASSLFHNTLRLSHNTDVCTSSDCSCAWNRDEVDYNRNQSSLAQIPEKYSRIQSLSRPPTGLARESLTSSQTEGKERSVDRRSQVRSKRNSRRSQAEDEGRDSKERSVDRGSQERSKRNSRRSQAEDEGRDSKERGVDRGSQERSKRNSRRSQAEDEGRDSKERGVDRGSQERSKRNSRRSQAEDEGRDSKERSVDRGSQERSKRNSRRSQAEDEGRNSAARSQENGNRKQSRISHEMGRDSNDRADYLRVEAAAQTEIETDDPGVEQNVNVAGGTKPKAVSSPIQGTATQQSRPGSMYSSNSQDAKGFLGAQARGSSPRSQRNSNKGRDVDSSEPVDDNNCIMVPCPRANRTTNQSYVKYNENMHFCYCNVGKNGEPTEGCNCEYFEADEPSGQQNVHQEDEQVATRTSQRSDPEASFSSSPLKERSTMTQVEAQESEQSLGEAKEATPKAKRNQSTSVSAPNEANRISTSRAATETFRRQDQSGAGSAKEESTAVARESKRKTEPSPDQSSSSASSKAMQNCCQFANPNCRCCRTARTSSQPWCIIGNQQWLGSCPCGCCFNREPRQNKKCRVHKFCNCHCQCCLKAFNMTAASAQPIAVEDQEALETVSGSCSDSGSRLNSRSAANTVGFLETRQASKADSKLRAPQASSLDLGSGKRSTKVEERPEPIPKELKSGSIRSSNMNKDSKLRAPQAWSLDLGSGKRSTKVEERPEPIPNELKSGSIRSSNMNKDSKLRAPQAWSLDLGSGKRSTKVEERPEPIPNELKSGSIRSSNMNKDAQSVTICPNCGININEFLYNSVNKDINFTESDARHGRASANEEQRVYRSIGSSKLTESTIEASKPWQSAGRNDEGMSHCNRWTNPMESNMCKLSPAKGAEDEPLVNLVVNDKCNVEQLIEILRGTVAALETQRNSAEPVIRQPVAAANQNEFHFDQNMENGNRNYMDRHQMIECHNAQSNQGQDHFNLNYNALPSNAYPQYETHLSQIYETPDTRNTAASLRIRTQTEYDYPAPAAEPGQQNNYVCREQCTYYPALSNQVRKRSGCCFPKFMSDINQSSPIGKQEVLQQSLPSKSFLELLDLTLAIKKRKEDFQKDKHKMRLSNERKRDLKLTPGYAGRTTDSHGKQLDRAYKDMNPTQPPFHINEVFNVSSVEKCKDLTEDETKFECNARGNRKRFSDVEHPVQKSRKDLGYFGHKYKRKTLHQSPSQETGHRKNLLRKQIYLEQNTSDSDYFRAANCTPRNRELQLEEREIRARKSSGFDQMRTKDILPSLYGFDSCRREPNSSEMKIMRCSAFYNPQERQSEASYFETRCSRRPQRKGYPLRSRERSRSRFQNLLRKRAKDKKENSNLYMTCEARSKSSISKDKIEADSIGENLNKSNSRGSFLFNKNHRMTHKLDPKAKPINDTKKPEREIKENKYFDYTELKRWESTSNSYTNKRRPDTKLEGERSHHRKSKNSESKIEHFPMRRMAGERRVSESGSRVLPKDKMIEVKRERPDFSGNFVIRTTPFALRKRKLCEKEASEKGDCSEPNKSKFTKEKQIELKGKSERSDSSVLKKIESRNRLLPSRKTISERTSDNSESKCLETRHRVFAPGKQIKDKADKTVIATLNSRKPIPLNQNQRSEKEAKDGSLNLKAISVGPNSTVNNTKRERTEQRELNAPNAKEHSEFRHKSHLSAPFHQEKPLKKWAPTPPPKPVKKAPKAIVTVSASNHKQRPTPRSYQKNESDCEDIKVLYDSRSKFSRHSYGGGDTTTDCESDTKPYVISKSRPSTSQNNFFCMLKTRDKLTDSKRYSR
ncbi:uncharacterized protein LOC111602533 isoform X2 [Drosophila hydei]|uniref:Uncharacterized protein LOC111602533 isoform X2 n=1 Tax=Drosophila hydei TaxID=7224 RepID=A0A6J2SQ36_DROHY|nr:uncharacterized protein LOC111602533 isoform X2 [Drosophila hydei]